MQNKLLVRRVNFALENDFAVLLWGSLGKSYRYIQRKTGLSYCQISYRLKKGTIKLADFRNGENEASRLVEQGVLDAIENRVRQQLRLPPSS